MVWRCACGFGVILPLFFLSFFFFSLFRRSFFPGQISSRIDIVGATPPRLFHRSFGSHAYLFYMVWRCACGLGVILPLSFFFQLLALFRLSCFFMCDTMTGSSYSFIPNVLKLCCFCHSLKICMCCWGYHPVIFYQLFSIISTFFFFFSFSFFFQNRLVLELWMQLILQFSTDRFWTMHTCSTWSVDVVLGLVFHYFYQLFPFIFSRSMLVLHDLKMCVWF